LERAALEQLLDSQPTTVYFVMRAVVRSVHAIVGNMNNQYVQLTNYINRQGGRY
jgi:hypothetical protein